MCLQAQRTDLTHYLTNSLTHHVTNLSLMGRMRLVSTITQMTRDSLSIWNISSDVLHGNVSKSLVNGISSQIQHLASGSGLPSLFDDGGKVMQKVIRRKAEQASGPTFLFANFMEAHTPYEYMRGMDRSMISAPLSWTSAGESIWDIHNDPEKYEDYLEYRREFYAASVDYLDRLVSSLIEDIRESSDRPVTFIITSDHGENNGFPHEDYLIDHKSSLSESLLHVPLEIIDAPEDVEFKQRFVSHLSLPDLVTALAQGTMPDVSQDVVSAEHMGMGAGEKPPEDERYWDRAMRCVYQGNRKVVYDSLGNVEEYNIDVNRSCWQTSSKELDNVPEFVSDQFSENITEAKENAEKQQTDMDIDPATEERLEDLGYR